MVFLKYHRCLLRWGVPALYVRWSSGNFRFEDIRVGTGLCVKSSVWLFLWDCRLVTIDVSLLLSTERYSGGERVLGPPFSLLLITL